MSYQVVFQSDGRDIETVYWTGSLDETRRLARQIARKCQADAFRILGFTNGAAEVCLEQSSFGCPESDCRH
jgi:hypothetical protein